MNRTYPIALAIALCAAMLVAFGGVGSDSTAAPAPGASASFMLPYRAGNEVFPSRLPHIAVDAAGGVHVVYAANAPTARGLRPAYYAYCASACTSTSRFATVPISDGLGDAQLQLTPAGKPRILLASTPSAAANTIEHQYWSCDSNCVQTAGWTGVVVVRAGMPFFPSDSENTQSFALDAQGRPRFVFQSNPLAGSTLGGAYLASCETGCTSAAQWRLAQLDETEWKNSALAIDVQGRPRIAYSMMQAAQPYALPVISYLECGQRDCSAGVTRLALTVTTTDGTLSTSAFALRLTTTGAPRMALYPGTGAGGYLTPNQLHYLWCDSSCTVQLGQWRSMNLSLPASYGQEGVDLALDGQNRPRVAVRVPVPVDELAYVWCDTGCVNASQNWQSKVLPSAKAAEAEMGLPARMGCPRCIPPIPPCPNAYWQAGYWPSITLDRNSNPVIAYEMQLQVGGGACSVGTLARLPRLMSFAQPR